MPVGRTPVGGPNAKIELSGEMTDFNSEIERWNLLHEYAHACGMYHELTSPNSNIVFNKQALYDYFEEKAKWTPEQVDKFVLTKYNSNAVFATAFDRNSVMLYRIPAEATNVGEITPGREYSAGDKAWFAAVYGKPGSGKHDKITNTKAPPYTGTAKNPAPLLYEGTITDSSFTLLLVICLLICLYFIVYISS